MGMSSFANETGTGEAPAPHAPVTVIVPEDDIRVPDPVKVPDVATTVPDVATVVPDVAVLPDSQPIPVNQFGLQGATLPDVSIVPDASAVVPDACAVVPDIAVRVPDDIVPPKTVPEVGSAPAVASLASPLVTASLPLTEPVTLAPLCVEPALAPGGVKSVRPPQPTVSAATARPPRNAPPTRGRIRA